MEYPNEPKADAASDKFPVVKVLHLIASPKIGGVEKLLLTILDNIDTEKYEVAVAVFVSARERRNVFHEEVRKAGVKVFPIFINGAYDLRQILQIYRAFATFNPDVIHTHGYKTNILGYLISLKFGTSIVATVHGWLHSNKLATRLFNRINLKLLRRFDRVIAVSGQIESVLLDFRIPATKLLMLRNVPSARKPTRLNRAALVQEFSLSSQAKFVGFIGRLEPVKGGEYFIAAAATVLETFPEVQFLIAGEGTDMDRLEAKVAQAGLSSQIRFLGFQDSPSDVFHLLDLYVLPSLDEGIPLTLLEAMSSDVPVVATSVGGVPEVIQDGINGILVPPGKPQELAEAICNSLMDPNGTARRVRAAKKTIGEKFNAERWIENLQAEYLNLKSCNKEK